MAEQNVMAEEVLLDVKVADASNLYKFYLSQEKKDLRINRGDPFSHPVRFVLRVCLVIVIFLFFLYSGTIAMSLILPAEIKNNSDAS